MPVAYSVLPLHIYDVFTMRVHSISMPLLSLRPSPVHGTPPVTAWVVFASLHLYI